MLPGFIRELSQLIIIIGVVFISLFLLTERFTVEGNSMLPALKDGQSMVVGKIAYARISGVGIERYIIQPPKRGDIIIFEPPTSTYEDDFVKRLIALPGDSVLIEDGKVLVNGDLSEFSDDYTHPGAYFDFTEPLRVPAGKLFVLGDNRGNSSDSRSWGFVDIETVIGPVWLIYSSPF